MSCEKVILIGGTGRSGTNILKEIFSKHSSCASLPFEYRFTIDPEGIVDFYNTYPALWSPYWADARIKRLENFLLSLAKVSADKAERTIRAKAFDPSGLKLSPPPYSGWELEKWIPGYEGFVKELITNIVDFEYPAIWPGNTEGVENNGMYFCEPKSKILLQPSISKFLNQCFNAICASQSKSQLVEDNTHNILFAADLLELIPNARLIHVVRDPRDVIASLMKQRWAPRELDQCISWYTNVMEAWERQKEKLNQHKFAEVKFESLVENKRQVIQQLCDFSGIEVEDAMTATQLEKHNIGRHKKELSESQIDQIDASCARVLARYHYPN